MSTKFSRQSPPKIYANFGADPGFTPRIRLYKIGSGNIVVSSPDDELELVVGTPSWIWDGSAKWPGGVSAIPDTSGNDYVYVIVNANDQVVEEGDFSIGPALDTMLETVSPSVRIPGAMKRPISISESRPYKIWIRLKDNLGRPVIPDSDPWIAIEFSNPANSSNNRGDDPGNVNPLRDTQYLSADGPTGAYSYVFNVTGAMPMDIISIRLGFDKDGVSWDDEFMSEIVGRMEFNTSRIANSGIIRP